MICLDILYNMNNCWAAYNDHFDSLVDKQLNEKTIFQFSDNFKKEDLQIYRVKKCCFEQLI